MPLKNCHSTFSLQRVHNSSSLRLKLCLRYSRLAIRRMGSLGRPALLTPAPSNTCVAPNRSWPSRTWPARSSRSNFSSSAASIRSHGMRLANTAKGSLRLIIASIRARKKSAVCILESPGNQFLRDSFLRESVSRVYSRKRVFTRVGGLLQGRLSSTFPSSPLAKRWRV